MGAVLDAVLGAVLGAGGAVGEGAGAEGDVGAVGAVGAGEPVGDAVGAAVGSAVGAAVDAAVGAAGGVADGEGEGTVLVAAGHEGAVQGSEDAEDVVDERRVSIESAGHGEGGGTGAVPVAERAGAEAGGGEDHVGDIAHLRSCRRSVSFCFVSVGRVNSLMHEDLQPS